MLIDRGMNKQDLRKLTGISSASIAKLGKGENVNTDILVRICKAMDCDISDIVEIGKSPHAPIATIKRKTAPRQTGLSES